MTFSFNFVFYLTFTPGIDIEFILNSDDDNDYGCDICEELISEYSFV